jgi:hypothetical protein
MKSIYLFIVLFSCSFSIQADPSRANPFLLPIEKKLNLSLEDFKELQVKLNDLKLVDYAKNFYANEKKKNANLMDEYFFLGRVLRASTTTIIDENKNKLPRKELIEINGGGDCCIVCYVTYTANYTEMLEQQIKELKRVGFKGFHLGFYGGYPNPTGEEIKFAAVPYAFKIFALKEAALLGFKKVMWLDAALVPNKNIQFLEKLLDEVGAIYTNLPPNGFYWYAGKRIGDHLPETTRKAFTDLIKIDPNLVNYVCGGLIAFNTTDALFNEFLKDYYFLVSIGYPFLSINPEEYVFTAILAQEKFKNWYNFNEKNKVLSLKDNHLFKSPASLFKILPHHQCMDLVNKFIIDKIIQD